MRARPLGIFATITLLTATACGGSGTDSGQTADGASADGLTPFKVGLVPVSAVAPIFLGEAEGIFEEHGLDLDIQVGIGGPSAVAAVESGNVDVAIADPAAMIHTSSQGLPYLAVAAAGSVGPDGVGGSQVVVKAGSDITTPADLNGTTVGVFVLQGANEFNVRAAIDAEGGDSSSVSFVNLEFAAMLAALERGDVDAAGIAEPLLSQAVESGKVEVVLDYYPIVFPNGSNITLWFTGNKQHGSNADALNRFRDALAEASEFADANPDAVRAILPDFSGIPAAEAETVPLQTYSAPLTEDVFARTVEMMQTYGNLDAGYTLDFDALLMP